MHGVVLQCAASGGQTSVTARTIFRDPRMPLPLWFRLLAVGENPEERCQRAGGQAARVARVARVGAK